MVRTRKVTKKKRVAYELPRRLRAAAKDRLPKGVGMGKEAEVAMGVMLRTALVDILRRSKGTVAGFRDAVREGRGFVVLPKTCAFPRARIHRHMRQHSEKRRWTKAAVSLLHRTTEELLARHLRSAATIMRADKAKTLSRRHFQAATALTDGALRKGSQ